MNTGIVVILVLVSLTALAVTTLLTAGAVYWQTSTHYQEILREKDASYWEHLGRTQTQGLHCEDQCKRLMNSSNHYYTTLISAYEDTLKTLLDTDTRSIQMREQSHREVLTIFHNRAMLVSEQTQISTVECVHTCQALHSNLTSQRNTIKRLTERSSQQKHSIVYLHKLLDECQQDKEESGSYTFWFGGILAAAVVVVYGSITTASQKQLTVDNSKECTQELADQLKRSELERTMVDQLKEKLAKAENKREELQKMVEEKENEKENTEKHYKEQLAKEKQRLMELVQIKRNYKIKISEQEKSRVQLLKQINNMKRELARSKSLESRIKVLDTRIIRQNVELLEYRNAVEQEKKEKKQIQFELSKQQAFLEERNGRVGDLKESNEQLRELLTELEMGVILKESELEIEKQSRIRALKGYEYQQERITILELERDRRSSAKLFQKKHRQHQPNTEEIRLEMHATFEVEYKRLELETHGRLAAVAEEVGRLKIESKEQQMKISRLKIINKTLTQLIEMKHTLVRREKADERCRVTVDLPVRHLSLTPPTYVYTPRNSCKY